MVKIRNEFLTVDISLKGAETLKVINNITGHNYMWDIVPEIWTGCSPVLFPTVGKSIDDTIRYKGKEYRFTNHGFARHSHFQCEIDENIGQEATLILSDEMIPPNSFPFRFNFNVGFRLSEKKLITTYKVSNPSAETIFFTLGAHPAFRFPFDKNHVKEDYFIEFEKDDFLTLHELTSSATYTGKTEKFPLEDGKLDLAKIDVSETFVFSGFKSDFVKLVEKESQRFIKVDIKDFRYIAFWKKPEGEFICIEPWIGKSDNVGFTGEFNEKNDMIELAPHKSFSINYGIEFGY